MSEYFVRSRVDEDAIKQADSDDPLCSGMYQFYKKTCDGIMALGMEGYYDQVKNRDAAGEIAEYQQPTMDYMSGKSYEPTEYGGYLFCRVIRDQGRVIRQCVGCYSRMEERGASQRQMVIIRVVACEVDGNSRFRSPPRKIHI